MSKLDSIGPTGSKIQENDEVDAPELAVGRAEWKLAGAVEEFKFDFTGKKVMDIGSSTGGFTEYALKNGAKSVIAIEKGTNQMKEPLRYDPRVELREKTDIFTVGYEDVDVVLADVSFVSLLKVLEHVAEQVVVKPTIKDGRMVDDGRAEAAEKVDFLVMMKPQFEARKYQMNRGVLKNDRMRRDVVKSFEEGLKRLGFVILEKRDNDFPGRKGNLERFYWLKLSK